MYADTSICRNIGRSVSSRSGMTNQDVRQGSPVSKNFNFNTYIYIYVLKKYIYIYIDAATYDWQIQLRSSYRIDPTVLNGIFFPDDQVIISESDCDLQTVTHQLQIITNNYYLKICTEKKKLWLFKASAQIDKNL
jgi:hypothetical protein